MRDVDSDPSVVEAAKAAAEAAQDAERAWSAAERAREALAEARKTLEERRSEALAAANLTPDGLIKATYVWGGRDTIISYRDDHEGYWYGHNKGSDDNQPMGTWEDWVMLALEILRHPNTQKVAPAAYCGKPETAQE